MPNYTKEDYIKAHKFSFSHKEKIINDRVCGCFYCLAIFSPSEINRWINDKKLSDKGAADEGMTGLCPYCGIDSVIGESSGYPIDKEFLKKMKGYWFDS